MLVFVHDIYSKLCLVNWTWIPCVTLTMCTFTYLSHLLLHYQLEQVHAVCYRRAKQNINWCSDWLDWYSDQLGAKCTYYFSSLWLQAILHLKLFSWFNSARWKPLMIHTMFFTKQSIQIVPRLVSHCDEVAYPLILFHCVNISLWIPQHPYLSVTYHARQICMYRGMVYTLVCIVDIWLWCNVIIIMIALWCCDS